MSAPRATTRTVKLSDGREFTLTLDFNAAADYEEQTGESFFKADNTSASAQRARLWALLQQAHPELTLRDVGALMAPGDPDFQALLEGMTALANAASGGTSKGGGAGKPKAKGR